MGRTIAWIACFLAIGAWEIPQIVKRGNRYDVWVYIGLLVVVTVYGMLYTLDVRLPDPNGLVKAVFGPIGRKIMGTPMQ